jgi:hypothetical protein
VEDVTIKTIMRAAHGRPAQLVWSFIALALMLPACAERTNNSDADVPTTVTERGVEIRDVERDKTRRTVGATVVEHGIERHLTLVPLPDGPSPGIVATLDEGGSFFEIALAVDERTGEVWIRERTAVDEMTITLQPQGERMLESYDINGDRIAFNRPALADAQMYKAVQSYRAGTIHRAPSPELQELGGVFATFDAYYTPTLSNTLHNNPAGALLMSLLVDEAMGSVVVGDDPTPDRKDGLVQRGCFVATRCAGLACLLGGVGNPICDACAGASAACAIMEMVCWVVGCDCCF